MPPPERGGASGPIEEDQPSEDQSTQNPNPVALVRKWLQNPGRSTAQMLSKAGPIVNPEDALKAMGLDRALSETEKKAVLANVAEMQTQFNKRLATCSEEERAVLMQQHGAMVNAVLGPVPVDPTKLSQDIPPDQLLLKAVRRGDVALAESAARTLLGMPDKPLDLSKLPPLRYPGDAHAHPVLHWACLEDNVAAVDWCLGRSRNVSTPCDVNGRNALGETALHWAALKGHHKAAASLLEEDPMLIQAADDKGYQVAHYAAQNSRLRFLCVVKLLDVDQLDVRDASSRTPLHWAAYKGSDEACKYLLDNGASIIATDKEQCLPIHWACIKGHISLIKLLIDTHRVEGTLLEALNAKDITNATPLELLESKVHKMNAELTELVAPGDVENPTDNDAQTRARLRLSKRTAIAKYEKCIIYVKFHLGRAELLRTVGAYAPRLAGAAVYAQTAAFPHWSWFMWPLLAPCGWYAFVVHLLPVVSHHVFLVALFGATFWLKWVFWISLQVRDPGNLVRISKRTGLAVGYARVAHDDSLDRDPSDVSRVLKIPKKAEHRDMFNEVIEHGLATPICLTCEIVKPPRSKHDRVTDVCIDKFDHFCPWMNSAVGRNNYGSFVLTSFCATISMVTWIFLVVFYTAEVDVSQTWFQNFTSMLKFELFCWFFLLTALYGVVMSGQHAWLIVKNLSTNELINRHRYRYLVKDGMPHNRVDQGWLLNIGEVFGLAAPIELDLREEFAATLAGEEDDFIAPVQHHGHSHAGAHGHSH